MAVHYIKQQANLDDWWGGVYRLDYGYYPGGYLGLPRPVVLNEPESSGTGGNYMTIRLKFTAYDTYSGARRDVTDYQEVSAEDEKYLRANLAFLRDVYKLLPQEQLQIETQQPTQALDLSSIKSSIADKVREKEQAGLKSKLRNDIRRYQESELKQATTVEAMQALADTYKARLSLAAKAKEAINAIVAA